MSRMPGKAPLDGDYPLQSAMEYLMTYGWAILIIAVVLGSLYSLGVFNTANLQPKVGPGGCHVYRPNGPETSWNINLVGSCQNALPQYVAQLATSMVVTPSGTVLPTGSFSFSVWVRTVTPQPSYNYPDILSVTDSSRDEGYHLMERWANGKAYPLFDDKADNYFDTFYDTNFLDGNWHDIVVTYSTAAGLYCYSDGRFSFSDVIAGNIVTSASQVYLGGQIFETGYFNGSIADLQIYNTSLTANQVAYLYQEGIGGVPIDLQSLVGWWPLNGDTTDYSGNNNNGVPTNVIFNGTWTSAYQH